MKKFVRQSGINFIILILVCIIGRIAVGSTYSQYIPLYYSSRDSKSFAVEQTDGDGSAEIEMLEMKDGYAHIKLHAESPGRVNLLIKDEAGENAAISDFRVGRFGTVYSLTTGGFTGDGIFLTAVMVFILVESLLLFRVFKQARGASFYSYNTIYAAGFSLFLFLTGSLLLMETVRFIFNPVNYSMRSVYSHLSSAGYNFMLMTFPLIFIFAVSMTLSNIALLRHERPRLQNVLGILISVLMVVGAVGAIFIVGMNYMGSETEYRIRQTIQNVYCTAYAYFECMLIGAVICGVKAAKHIPKDPADYILILGCGFRKDGTLPPLLRGRVDRAIAFWKEQREKGKTAVLVPSGGQGPDEVMAEAEAMRRYLAAEGIPEEYILPENQSKNTYQNMLFSKKLIENENKDARVIYSTTNYHVFRSGVWASLAGLKAEGIGSKTKWWYWPNAFMRECIGLLANRWKQELLFLLLLLVLFGAMSLVLII